MSRERKRSRSRLLGILALLLLLALLLPLSDFLAGLLLGGGRLERKDEQARKEQDPGTLKVTVLRAEDRAPVAGAVLLVNGQRGVASGPAGHALLRGLGRGPVRVEVEHAGRVAAAWADPTTQTELQLAVAPPPMRTGVVRNADGSPASVRVLLLGAHGEQLDATQTDAEGRYRLIHHRDAVCVCTQGPDATPVSKVEGDVTLASGEPVRGRILGAGRGTLEVYGDVAAPNGDGRIPLRAQWPLDETGAFAGSLPPHARAWGIAGGVPVRIRAGDIEIEETVTVRGRVMGPGAVAVPRASLLFRPLLDGDFDLPLPGLRIETDDEGNFEAAGFTGGRYALEVRASGFATRLIAEVIPSAGPLTVELVTGFEVRGFVVGTTGLPIADADVIALGLPEDPSRRPLARQHAGDRGAFHLRGLGGKFARVRVTAPGYWPTTLERVAPGARLRVVLQKK